MSRLPALVLLAAVLVVAPSPTHAQDRATAEAIGSDRPGLGDGGHVVGTGVWQLEVGATIQDAGIGDTEVAGSALLRWGLVPLELRIYLPSPILSRGDGGVELGDLGVGVKAGLADGGAWNWAVVAGATLPVGTSRATSDEAIGFVTLAGDATLTETVDFGLNLGYMTPFDGLGDGTFSVIATPSTPLGEGVIGYAGYAGYFGRGSAADAHWLEAGLALARTPDTQWDVNLGWNAEGGAWFLGVGIATRWRQG